MNNINIRQNIGIKGVSAILVLFCVFVFSSCSSSNPLGDPFDEGADLPEVFYSENYVDNLTYSYLKYQEAQEMIEENSNQDKIRDTLMQSASYARIAINQAEFDISSESHEFYQDLLLNISQYHKNNENNIFVNRLVNEYEIFSKEDRTNANIRYLYARALYLTKKPDDGIKAIHICTDLIKRIDSEHYKTWFLLATILYTYDDFENALTYYQQAFQLRSNVNDMSALRQIARVYKAMGQFEDAIRYLQSYLDTMPLKHLTIEDYEELANLHVKIGNLETAEYILTKEVPYQLVSQKKCKHYKLLGIIELEIINKLEEKNSSLNDIELEKEKVLMVRSAKFAFEQYLRFYPDDEIALNLLKKLKADYNLN